jgi:hypothetical protein
MMEMMMPMMLMQMTSGVGGTPGAVDQSNPMASMMGGNMMQTMMTMQMMQKMTGKQPASRNKAVRVRMDDDGDFDGDQMQQQPRTPRSGHFSRHG